MRRSKQLELRIHPRGGKRRGAGRKPKGERAGVSHLRRPELARLLPVHVTLRMERHVYNLRSRRSFSIVGRAIASAAERFGVTIVQFSVQGNHVHLIVEASDRAALSRAMQGFSIRVAKGLNRMMHRNGRVLADRFHAHVLRTPTEARRAVAYVRNNHQKHTSTPKRRAARVAIDPYASPAAQVALPSPRSWLLRARASLERRHRRSADAGYEPTEGVAVAVALRAYVADVRIGGLIDLGGRFELAFPELDVRPVATVDFAVHRASDLTIWIGAGLGPSIAVTSRETRVGLAALATLDVAFPLSHTLAFDVIVRAGGEAPLSPSPSGPTPFCQIAFGVTWDFLTVSPTRGAR